jgi:hypothetical protein
MLTPLRALRGATQPVPSGAERPCDLVLKPTNRHARKALAIQRQRRRE